MGIISGPGSFADPHTLTCVLVSLLTCLEVKVRTAPPPLTPPPQHTQTTPPPLTFTLNLPAPTRSNSHCALVATDVKTSTFN